MKVGDKVIISEIGFNEYYRRSNIYKKHSGILIASKKDGKVHYYTKDGEEYGYLLEGAYIYAVKWDCDWGNNPINCYKKEDIKPANIRNTKLSRKLNPNHKEINKDWLEIV